MLSSSITVKGGFKWFGAHTNHRRIFFGYLQVDVKRVCTAFKRDGLSYFAVWTFWIASGNSACLKVGIPIWCFRNRCEFQDLHISVAEINISIYRSKPFAEDFPGQNCGSFRNRWSDGIKTNLAPPPDRSPPLFAMVMHWQGARHFLGWEGNGRWFSSGGLSYFTMEVMLHNVTLNAIVDSRSDSIVVVFDLNLYTVYINIYIYIYLVAHPTNPLVA